MCGIVDSSYFPPRFILVGLCAYFIEALRVQRYEKFLIYANFGGTRKQNLFYCYWFAEEVRLFVCIDIKNGFGTGKPFANGHTDLPPT